MGINIRAKGQNGEREVGEILEKIIREALKAGNYPQPIKQIVQRNQNQSAVGGSDLTNTCGLAVEVKRHETLQINTWWKQCVNSAAENDEIPCLFYRQNRQKWKVRIRLPVQYSPRNHFLMPVTLELEEFILWFKRYVEVWLLDNYDKLRV